MKSTEALRMLAGVTAYQWGMVTTAQAAALGVSRLDLSRLADAGHLERLTHGVYKDAGAPGDQFDDMRAAWLSTDPKRLSYDRSKDRANDVVFAGASAARLHDIGELWDRQHDFIAPTRRQSQRPGIHYRQRKLDPRDVTTVEGLPALSLEATIADLFNAEADLSHIGNALRDAAYKSRIDFDRLQELLAPYAVQAGLRKGDGVGLLQRLMELAGIDVESMTRFLARSEKYGDLAQVVRVVENVGDRRAVSGAERQQDRSTRRYDRDMTEMEAPARNPLSGPAGQRVAAHRGELREVLRRHGVTNPEIFGSAARGDDHEGSDVDILVDFPPGTSIIDIIGIQNELEDLLGVHVDLVPRNGLKERVRVRAAKDLIAL